MTEERIKNTLELISTVQEAVSEMFSRLNDGDNATFLELSKDVRIVLERLVQEGKEQTPEIKGLRLDIAADSSIGSLDRIVAFSKYNIPLALHKTEFELIPFVNDMYSEYYFWSCVFPYRERWEDYFRSENDILLGNPYVERAKEEGHYKYDLSIIVFSYNKLEYTKMCVDCVLKNIPKDLRCELILINNGSSDGTKEYYESKYPTKQWDVKHNWAFYRTAERIMEGEYYLWVSNDVLVMDNSVENMLRALKDDPWTGIVVPATTHVSNNQDPLVSFGNPATMMEWASNNNIYDPFRHEVMTRLINPIQMGRTSQLEMAFNAGYRFSDDSLYYSFPDDVQSLLCRRKGLKLVLAKDAFCYHYGSVTVKDEDKKREGRVTASYEAGRKLFEDMFGIDPWGTGCWYDIAFASAEPGFDGHIDILGINTGLGANPLKIRELYKEKRHNTDVKLTYADENDKFFDETKAYSDRSVHADSVRDLLDRLSGERFNHIVYEIPFGGKVRTLKDVEALSALLVPGGELYIKTDAKVESGVYECVLPEGFGESTNWVRLIKV